MPWGGQQVSSTHHTFLPHCSSLSYFLQHVFQIVDVKSIFLNQYRKEKNRKYISVHSIVKVHFWNFYFKGVFMYILGCDMNVLTMDIKKN